VLVNGKNLTKTVSHILRLQKKKKVNEKAEGKKDGKDLTSTEPPVTATRMVLTKQIIF
jgi:hypothetical protein